MTEPNNVVFNHPFACLVTGPSKSGKSQFVRNVLTYNNQLINKKIERIIYCYSTWQKEFGDLIFKSVEPKVEFNLGLPEIETVDPTKNNMIILDDLMNESGNDTSICDLFCVDSHHKSISVFLMTQNLFPKSKNSRTISLNCDYIVLMTDPRDRAQIGFLSRNISKKLKVFD